VADPSSVSEWIAGLKAGEVNAIQKLWDRYKDRLVELAHERLRRLPGRIADGDDLAQSVFLCFYRGATAGRLNDIRSRDELWWLLLAITRKKTVSLIRRETAKKRGSGRVRSETAMNLAMDGYSRFVLDELEADSLTPETATMMDEEAELLLNRLRDDLLRRVAVLRVEGYTVTEIARHLSISERAVERKLNLIRKAWKTELFSAP
jgi:DNA-directed RNA polymerase specialized sigma24 family protein